MEKLNCYSNTAYLSVWTHSWLLSHIKILIFGQVAYKIELNLWRSKIFEKIVQIGLRIRLFFDWPKISVPKAKKKKSATCPQIHTKWDFIILCTNVLSHIKILIFWQVAHKIELNLWRSKFFEKNVQIGLRIRLFFRSTQNFCTQRKEKCATCL